MFLFLTVLSLALVEVVKGCPFNCNPRNELEMCENCLERKENGELEVERRKMRVIDLPLSTTVDRLVGTIDIQKALKEGIRALHPGILAEANRSILYIDEVNLLDDYIADVLLDAAAMGWNIIEREGVSLKHPARFILVGSMNPEEGELRPQILDRFGLYVNIEALNKPKDRIEIVRRVEEFQADPISFRKKFEREQNKIRKAVIRAREIVNEVEIDDDLLELLVNTIIENGIKTHRAEIITIRTAKAIAALEGRKKVNLEDLKKAMELALPHRFREKPFDRPTLPPQLNPPESKNKNKESNRREDKKEERKEKKEKNRNNHMHLGNEGMKFNSDDIEDVNIKIKRGEGSTAKKVSRGSRDERATVIGYPHGYPVSSVPSKNFQDIDIIATIRSALSNGRKTVEDEDFRVRVRKVRLPRLTVILLDTSGSMIAMKRIKIAKGIAKRLIENSYVKRDSLALITFRGGSAEVIVPPTRRYSTVMSALENVIVGGRTPLASALQSFLFLAKSFRMKNKNSVVKGILITDGKANASLYGKAIREEIQMLTSALRKSDVKLEIYDTRGRAIDPAPSYIDLISSILNAPVVKV